MPSLRLQHSYVFLTARTPADAWNMLHGAGRDTCGNDAEIDTLHTAATNAKRTIENVSKVLHTSDLLICIKLRCIFVGFDQAFLTIASQGSLSSISIHNFWLFHSFWYFVES